MHDLDHDISNRTRSNVNIQNESQRSTFYLMIIVMLVLYVTVYDICAVEICMTLTMTVRIGQGEI